MPVMTCKENGLPGFKFGDAGKCYTYAAGDKAAMGKAKQKAYLQGVAIGDGKLEESDGEEVIMTKKLLKAHLVKTKDLKEASESPFANINEASIDSDNMTIKGACLFGARESANKRIYTDKAIESINRLSDGVKCYINHPTKTELKERDGVRDLRDWVGVYRNPRREGVKVFGDLVCREQYFDLARDIALLQPANVGNSINARVKAYQGDNGMESIADVEMLRSVDLVSNAATTTSLFEAAIEENLEPELLISSEIIDSMVNSKFRLAMVEEGLIQDKIGNDKIKREIDELSWTANDLINKTLYDDDLSIADKKKKVAGVFEDLDAEVKKRLKTINESIMEEENMELTIDVLKKDHSDLISTLFEEFKKGEEVETIKTDLTNSQEKVTALEDQIKTKDEELEKATTELNDLKSAHDELKKKLDELEAGEKATAKKVKVTEMLDASKLGKEFRTEIFVESLMEAEDEERIQKLIDDRKLVSAGKKITGAGDEFTEKDAEESKKDAEESKKDFLSKMKGKK